MTLPPAPAALPERFNRLESMLFAAEAGHARRAAERYVGELLARPVCPPSPAPAMPLRPDLESAA
ncbi:MAG: hypothetical protein K0V04_03930 [Deltaproteobacteria bacterium]|nr:hypothetical protein [Deltaproteobacteria bacterium]